VPGIYEARCSKCGNKRLLSDSSLAVQLDDGTLRWLRHPLESFDLEKAGFTWEHAYDEARMVRSEPFICRQCGGIFEKRSFVAPAGCLSAVLFIAAAYICFALAMRAAARGSGAANEVAALCAAAVAALAFAVWAKWRTGRRYRQNLPRRPALSDVRCCEAATPKTLIRVGRLPRPKGLACKACGGVGTVAVRCVGIS
jgi:hypothetical protein